MFECWTEYFIFLFIPYCTFGNETQVQLKQNSKFKGEKSSCITCLHILYGNQEDIYELLARVMVSFSCINFKVQVRARPFFFPDSLAYFEVLCLLHLSSKEEEEYVPDTLAEDMFYSTKNVLVKLKCQHYTKLFEPFSLSGSAPSPPCPSNVLQES